MIFATLIQRVLEKFPEYLQTTSYADNDHALQYSFFSGFTRYICERIHTSHYPEKELDVIKFFDFQHHD